MRVVLNFPNSIIICGMRVFHEVLIILPGTNSNTFSDILVLSFSVWSSTGGAWSCCCSWTPSSPAWTCLSCPGCPCRLLPRSPPQDGHIKWCCIAQGRCPSNWVGYLQTLSVPAALWRKTGIPFDLDGFKGERRILNLVSKGRVLNKVPHDRRAEDFGKELNILFDVAPCKHPDNISCICRITRYLLPGGNF